MASFRINFQAQTTGDHYIGYRTYNDPPNTYTVLTVNITGAVPQLAHVDIPVPGNLYCAYDGIAYTGYIIAACEDQTDADMDGIPDVAIQWTVNLLQQTDPCVHTNIRCDQSSISDITWTGGTSGCTPAGSYALIITETNPGDEIIPASATVTVDGGGVITEIIILDSGNYKAAPTVTLPPAISGCSPAVVLTAVMANCVDIDLLDFICAAHTELSGDTIYGLSLGEDLDICADISTLGGLPPAYLATPGDNCHCKDCVRARITTGGLPASYITISYQRCWDDATNSVTLITRTIAGGTLSVDLGCIIDGTLHIDDSTLSTPGAYTVLYSPCV